MHSFYTVFVHWIVHSSPVLVVFLAPNGIRIPGVFQARLSTSATAQVFVEESDAHMVGALHLSQRT